MVGPEVLKLSTKIKMTPLEGEHEFEDINSFKIKNQIRYFNHDQ